MTAPESIEPTADVTVHLTNEQSFPVDLTGLLDRGRQIISSLPVRGSVTVVLVTDEEIHRINREFLQHDWATDVISFAYQEESDAGSLASEIDGELVISVDTAREQAEKHGWSLDDELLLYFTHGFLHLCGYDDLTDEERPRMRQKERELLSIFHLCPRGLQN